MLWTLGSAKRRRRLAQQAAHSRASAWRRQTALLIVIFYNVIAFADIGSTLIAIDAGVGEEANPILRLTMEHVGLGWVGAKLAMQGIITFMVLWFPHWVVLGFFALATMGNAWVVYNNFAIVGVM